VLRVADLGRTASVMREGGVAGVIASPFSIRVPVDSACGVALEFRAA